MVSYVRTCQELLTYEYISCTYVDYIYAAVQKGGHEIGISVANQPSLYLNLENAYLCSDFANMKVCLCARLCI